MERENSEVWFKSLKDMLDNFAEKNVGWFEKYLHIFRYRYSSMLQNNDYQNKNHKIDTSPLEIGKLFIIRCDK